MENSSCHNRIPAMTCPTSDYVTWYICIFTIEHFCCLLHQHAVLLLTNPNPLICILHPVTLPSNWRICLGSTQNVMLKGLPPPVLTKSIDLIILVLMFYYLGHIWHRLYYCNNKCNKLESSNWYMEWTGRLSLMMANLCLLT